MFVYTIILFKFILLLIPTKAQYYLYYTDPTSETDLYYSCLYYEAYTTFLVENTSVISQDVHQVIPYCLRPLNQAERYEIKVTRRSISSNLTFAELKQQNVTIQQLLSWFAPIDLIERYQNYLDASTLTLSSELFYNCTLRWFGPSCEYTFDSNESFNDIVSKTFIAKGSHENSILVQNITNLTCYVYLQCDRGPAPICLDWREICDGRVDCLNDGIDERGCIDLEINECEENEYRCHNGMCIPEQFINDNMYSPDCLDYTDEYDDALRRTYQLIGSVLCFKTPTFLCEESDSFFGFRGFVCGDGQNIKMETRAKFYPLEDQIQCANGRDFILTNSVLTDAIRSSHLTFYCEFIMKCILFGKYRLDCIRQACERQGFPCSLFIERMCNQSSYVMLPMLPLVQAYAQFGFWTNTVITYQSLERIPMPDFACFNTRYCLFHSSNFQIGNFKCLDLSQLDLFDFQFFNEYLYACLTVDETGNETDCFYPSLFHCPRISKCISRHRLLDGIIDCIDFADELYPESCDLIQQHRFRCLSENKCISPTLIHDYIGDCAESEDERLSYKKKLSFQSLCTGYTDSLPILIDGKNETDETNCEQWPCNNPYTRCDGAWTCPNGADEIDCNSNSTSCPGQHECVSPSNFKIICLPVHRAGDGIIDCLGAADEREHCRRMNPDQFWLHYRCWNDTKCTRVACYDLSECEFETTNSIQKICQEDQHFMEVLQNIKNDHVLGSRIVSSSIYFVLYNGNRFQLSASSASLTMTRDTWTNPAENTGRPDSDFFSFRPLPKEISLHHAWMCNRGIVVFVGIHKKEQCLCPPSYYGHRCQFQNQRVSLTVQFHKECAPICHGVYGIVLKLVDNDQLIYSYEQLTYISTKNCTMKYNLYLLYEFRPKNLTKNYSIYIDAYNKLDLTHYTSWRMPVKLHFLPVNRIAAYLIIPAHPMETPKECPLLCGDHGRCAKYANTGEYFCRCESSWSGWNCSIRENDCDCSPDSICFGRANNRSICLCPLNKSGRRCLIHSICQNNPCKNSGQCIPTNDRVSLRTFTCICVDGYSGIRCEARDTSIEISFRHVKIPESLRIDFVTVQESDDPLITTRVKTVAFDQNSIIVYRSIPFNLIFVGIDTEFYLAFLQVNATRFAHIGLEMKTFHRCLNVDSLFDEEKRAFLLIRRAKYYHALCRNQSQLSCLYDKERFMCLCHKDGYANCFPFDFNIASICPGRTICENDGQCLLDRTHCPTSTICVCPKCFFGGKCQFTTKTSSLSLDVILGYHIRPHTKITQQRVAVKVSITLTTLMLAIGVINSILSIITFRLKKLGDAGVRIYLLALSIISLICILVFVLKFWLLILAQMALITHRKILLINCISMEFIIRSLVTMLDWLSACIAIERILVVIKGVAFNQTKSKQNARWISIIMVLCVFVSYVHDPIHRRTVFDEDEQRTWCVVRYSSRMKIFDSVIHILHFVIPFSINFISAFVIIIRVARTHSTIRKQNTYGQHLRKEFHQQKHLVISPLILVILSFPRLLVSILPGCMKSAREPWLYLLGYFISFMPLLLTFVIFVWPSESYKKEFDSVIRGYLTVIQRRFILNSSQD